MKDYILLGFCDWFEYQNMDKCSRKERVCLAIERSVWFFLHWGVVLPTYVGLEIFIFISYFYTPRNIREELIEYLRYSHKKRK